MESIHEDNIGTGNVFFIRCSKNPVECGEATKMSEPHDCAEDMNRSHIKTRPDIEIPPSSVLHSYCKNVYKCPYCGKLFDHNYYFKAHLTTHSNLKLHVCQLCGKSFTLKSYLKAHLFTHSGEKSQICKYCLRTFISKASLNRHMKRHNCAHCRKSFSRNNNLNIHLFSQHSFVNRKPHFDNSFLREEISEKHMNTYTALNRHICTQCNEAFSSKTHFKTHMLIHTELEPQKCVLCNQSFFVHHLCSVTEGNSNPP